MPGQEDLRKATSLHKATILVHLQAPSLRKAPTPAQAQAAAGGVGGKTAGTVAGRAAVAGRTSKAGIGLDKATGGAGKVILLLLHLGPPTQTDTSIGAGGPRKKEKRGESMSTKESQCLSTSSLRHSA